MADQGGANAMAEQVAGVIDALARRGAGVSLAFEQLEATLGGNVPGAKATQVRLNGRLTVEVRERGGR